MLYAKAEGHTTSFSTRVSNCKVSGLLRYLDFVADLRCKVLLGDSHLFSKFCSNTLYNTRERIPLNTETIFSILEYISETSKYRDAVDSEVIGALLGRGLSQGLSRFNLPPNLNFIQRVPIVTQE